MPHHCLLLAFKADSANRYDARVKAGSRNDEIVLSNHDHQVQLTQVAVLMHFTARLPSRNCKGVLCL